MSTYLSHIRKLTFSGFAFFSIEKGSHLVCNRKWNMLSQSFQCTWVFYLPLKNFLQQPYYTKKLERCNVLQPFLGYWGILSFKHNKDISRESKERILQCDFFCVCMCYSTFSKGNVNYVIARTNNVHQLKSKARFRGMALGRVSFS